MESNPREIYYEETDPLMRTEVTPDGFKHGDYLYNHVHNGEGKS